MSVRRAGSQTIEQPVWVTLCDECGATIDRNRTFGTYVRLDWSELDCLGYDHAVVPENPADLCSTACLRAFVDRVEALSAPVSSGTEPA